MLLKKLLWTARVSVSSALALTAASRLASALWRRTTHEPPPRRPRWARWLVARPVQGIVGRVGARKAAYYIRQSAPPPAKSDHRECSARRVSVGELY